MDLDRQLSRSLVDGLVEEGGRVVEEFGEEGLAVVDEALEDLRG